VVDVADARVAELARLLDAEHVETVRTLVDLPVDVVSSLQRLCRLASAALGAAESSVSVVSDAEYLVAHATAGVIDGPDDPPQLVPLDDSFCRYTVAGDRPFTVADARLDTRTHDMPCVVSGESRSYLGIPLHLEGRAVGTLCVYGPDIRTYGAAEIRLLSDLAEGASSELQLHAERRRLTAVNEQLTAALQAAEQAARRCSLTGVLNRFGLLDACASSMAASTTDVPSYLHVLMVDLDGFKKINDEYGHATGDRVLAVVAQRMSSVARATDLVARLGGDEFVLVVSGGSAAEISARLTAAIAEPISVEGVVVSVGASVGAVSLTPGELVDLAALLDRADQEMYRAKRRHPSAH
jgi:diguanylate cyclase (GGDEF)-like protein